MSDDAYRRTTVRDGVTLNYRTLEMLTVVDRALSFSIVLTQGSYNTSVSQSGGTHDGGGALDVRAHNLTSSQRESVVYQLRKAGFAAWLRTPAQGDWPYHIHAIAVGDRELSPAAADQVADYYAGRNGLASNAPDDGPRQFVGVVHPQELDMSFYGPEHWDGPDWAKFDEKAGWLKTLTDGNGAPRDAKKILEYVHRNGIDGEEAAKAAKTAAEAAKAASDVAATAANAAQSAAEEVLAVVRPPA